MNNWLKKLKKKAILPAAAFLVAAAAIGTTFAWQTWDLSITNNLKAHDTKVTIDEEGFDPNTGVKPVTIENDGDSSVFLRVAYSQYWLSHENLEGREGNNVEPVWQGTTILPNNKYAEKTWTSSWQTDWVYDDGWYYYTKVLTQKGTVGGTVKILERVDFVNLPPEYEAANYRLFFKAEVVQCSDGSNTLNSDAVNANATFALFGKTARVKNGSVEWYSKKLGQDGFDSSRITTKNVQIYD